MESSEPITDDKNSIEEIFGSDDASAFVKAELIIPDEKNVKIE